MDSKGLMTCKKCGRPLADQDYEPDVDPPLCDECFWAAVPSASAFLQLSRKEWGYLQARAEKLGVSVDALVSSVVKNAIASASDEH